jgi:cyclopropane fatty-acyl-phospholipid synthase-like methyltransferase
MNEDIYQKMIDQGHAETVGGGNPEEISTANFALMRRLLRLQPDMQLLDFGCGCGRVSLPILDYLSVDGTYVGVDIIPDLIQFCTDEIGSKFNNASFACLRKSNEFYDEKISPTTIDNQIEELLELGEEQFDIIIAFSVFTHLYKKEANEYLKLLAKLLKPNGQLLLSTFLINTSSKKFIRQGEATPTFRLFPKINPGVYYSDRTNKLGAVAFEEQYLIRAALGAGFDPITVAYGNWCGRHAPDNYQDTVVLSRSIF